MNQRLIELDNRGADRYEMETMLEDEFGLTSTESAKEVDDFLGI